MRRYTFSNTTALLILPLLLAINLSASAETPYWYEVEVALIGYQDSQQIDHESWPEVLINKDQEAQKEIHKEDPASLESTNEEVAIKEKTLPWAWIDWWNSKEKGIYSIQGSHTVKPTDPLSKPFSQHGLAFEDKMGRFEKAKGFNIIWSQKWQQPIQDKSSSTSDDNIIKINFTAPLNLIDTINKGSSLDEIEISGNIHLYRSRYLHFVSDLQVQHWRTLMNSNTLDHSLATPHSNKESASNIIPSSSSTPLTAIDKIPLRAAEVSQSRRMRSNELHYLDHPMIGILVRATPIDYQAISNSNEADNTSQ